MVNFSNILSLLRAPLAFLFLSSQPSIRALAIVFAMVTDCLDGYFARRFSNSSQLGAVLDPLMDKFFVVFAFTVFILEGKLSLPSLVALLCRDIAVVIFGIYLWVTEQWKYHRFRAIWCGKITTALQFFVLFALTFTYCTPPWFYMVFVVLGIFALIELYFTARPSMAKL